MARKTTLLLIDDEHNLRQMLARLLELEGYEVLQARNAYEGFELLESFSDEIDVILTDVKLPDGNGLNILRKIKERDSFREVILLTAFGTIQDGVNAMKQGAFDYLTKGDSDDQLLVAIARAAEKVSLRKRVAELEKQVAVKYNLESIIGCSPAIKQAKGLTARVAVTDSTVLLEGETGVGKELFAQALHSSSSRHNKPFVAVNCSAFPKDLLESEIFGYKKGAFTGAVKDRKGYFEEANGGTLFLDEIAEMPFELQAKFLRVLETQTFNRLGDAKAIKVNVRIVAATNRDLQAEAEARHFRTDLYYRLSVFKIRIPSLHERQADIPLLAHHFLQLYNSKLNRRLQGISEEFIQLLQAYPWKGNIRELKNVMERAIILTDSEILTPDSLPVEFRFMPHRQAAEGSDAALSAMERVHILKVLEESSGNKTEAARRLRIGLTTLYRKIQEYELS